MTGLPYWSDVAALVAGHLFMFGAAWHMLRTGLGSPAVVQVLNEEGSPDAG